MDTDTDTDTDTDLGSARPERRRDDTGRSSHSIGGERVDATGRRRRAVDGRIWVKPARMVARGYDRIADRYRHWSAAVRVEERERYTRLLLERLPAGAEVLDLGCGSGELLTARLARQVGVTGVDVSARQIELARQQVPTAWFIQADMTRIDFPPASFDAVVAFYSLTHLPRAEVAPLLRSVARWLRPGGLFVASMGARFDPGSVVEEWLGAPMFFSGFESAESQQLVEAAGLEVERAVEETADEDGVPITFLWVVARKANSRSCHSG